MDSREMIRMSVHETNTPIAVIHGYADLIECGIIDGEKAKSTAGKMKSEAKRLSRLIEEMSVYAGIKDGTVYDKKVYLDIESIIKSAADQVKTDTKTDFEIIIKGCGSIYANKELFTIMITHLIDNAVIYNDNKEKTILCSILSTEDGLSITIDDNGTGIDETEREAVFECFYRENKEYSRMLGGNGMGLAICREIAKSEGMEIFISDSSNGGTRITVEKSLRGK